MPPPVTGGHVTGPLVITRSGWFVVAVRHVVAFPAGVEVEAAARNRGQRRDQRMSPGFRDCVSASFSPAGVWQCKTMRPGCGAEQGPC